MKHLSGNILIENNHAIGFKCKYCDEVEEVGLMLGSHIDTTCSKCKEELKKIILERRFPKRSNEIILTQG